MSALQPMAVYALKVDPGDGMVPAMPSFNAMVRITMAAIDPSEDPDAVDIDQSTMTQRSTLKLIRFPDSMFDEDDDDEEDDDEDDEDDLDDEEELNGGPSDLKKSEKAKKLALLEALAADEDEEDDDDDMDEDDDDEDDDEEDEAAAKTSLKALVKGKEKASDEDEDDDSDLDMDEGLDLEDVTEMAICTLDTKSHYQQPLDLTVQENEKVFFRVMGSHPVYITGNYVVPSDFADGKLLDDYDEEDDEYDLSPDEDELDGLDALVDGDDESDELDDIEDPRITEVDVDEEAPELIKNAIKKEEKPVKGKNKRPVEESDDDDDEPGLDDIMAKSLKKEEAAPAIREDPATTNGDAKKLSKAEKKKLKKLKKNDGSAADVSPSASTLDGAKESKSTTNGNSEKKVQFDKDLVKGPTPNGDSKAAATNGAAASTNKSVSIKEVNGVTIDDRKLGNGPAAKKGSKLDMRYIGKLAETSAVFDSNKTGKPFSFKLGSGDVIKGWDIGLEGIKVGGERRITIPAHLGYGKKSMPGIPANSKLIFDIKCLGVK